MSMPTVDNRTIVLVSSLVYVVLAVAVAIAGAALRRYRGPGHWAAGVGGFALCSLLIFLRGPLPVWLSFVASNVGLVASLCLIAHGLALFLDAPPRVVRYVGACVASLLGQAYFTMIQDSFTGRVMVGSLCYTLVTVDMMLAVRRSPQPGRNPGTRFLVGVCIALIASHLLRGVAVLMYPLSDLFQAHGLLAISLVVLPLLILALVLGLLVLAATRFAGELEGRGAELARANEELRGALENVRVLSGLLRVCAWCKRVHADDGSWHQMEAYLQAHSEIVFTHGVCPECAVRLRRELG